MKRILIVEDNPDLAYGLRNNLEIEGYEVEVSEDGVKGLARAREARPDLVILDLMLPGLDGYRVLRKLRDDGFTMPVLILTARGEEADKVTGFRLGADDYVTKPFGLLELIARVAALLRRAGGGNGAGSAGPPERFGDIFVDPRHADRHAQRRGRGADADGVRPADGPAEAARECRLAHRTAARGVGALGGGRDAHGGHARRRVAPEAGRRPGQPALHPDRAQGRVPARTLVYLPSSPFLRPPDGGLGPSQMPKTARPKSAPGIVSLSLPRMVSVVPVPGT